MLTKFIEKCTTIYNIKLVSLKFKIVHIFELVDKLKCTIIWNKRE